MAMVLGFYGFLPISSGNTSEKFAIGKGRISVCLRRVGRWFLRRKNGAGDEMFCHDSFWKCQKIS